MNQTVPLSPKPTEYRYVSTAQVSQALGVSVTTVKRWVDDGVLPAHRTAGGHRKLLLSDVLRLVREANLPQADLSRLVPKETVADPTDPSKLYPQLLEAIQEGDADRIRTMLHGSYNAGVPMEILADRIISPALQHVGHEWSVGRMDIMQEHRITQAIVSAMYELKAYMKLNAEKDRPVCVGGAPEHDHYILPSLVTKMTLIECGWDAINLGPHTPFSAFRAAIDELSPQMVWVSLTHVHDAESFIRDYRDFYKHAEDRGIAVAIGGRGFSDTLRMKVPYTTYGDGMVHLASFARTLYRRPGRPKRGRPPGSGKSDSPIDELTA
jgi:MerR family transcriptional regulator, light-induced transcriptional regulator